MDAKQIEDILNLDCQKKENKTKLIEQLKQIKPVKKEMVKQNKTIPNSEILEKCLVNISSRYGFRSQGIMTHFETETDSEGNKTKNFIFYSCSWMDNNCKWIGTVYSKTLWEMTAKSIFKLYQAILKERNR